MSSPAPSRLVFRRCFRPAIIESSESACEVCHGCSDTHHWVRRVADTAHARIGRERELAQIQQLLMELSITLVTLTGPGGVGKTRLALAAAEHAAANFADGVTFAGLAPLQDPTLVLPTIAQALRIAVEGSPIDALTDALAVRQMLLVLDNFEQSSPARRGHRAIC